MRVQSKRTAFNLKEREEYAKTAKRTPTCAYLAPVFVE